MTTGEKPAAAFVLSLISGVLVLAASMFGLTLWSGVGYWGGWGWMMCPGCGMMGGWWTPTQWPFFSVMGLVSGTVIIASALMLQSRPSQAQTWGVLILVFSIVSIFGLGGFLVGALLGIIGGIFALTWKPS